MKTFPFYSAQFHFRLAINFCPLDLETLIDPSDKIKSRLFAKVVNFVFLVNGHYFKRKGTVIK